MAIGINTNTNSLNIQNNSAEVKKRLEATFEKLAAGHRINSAKDDAAGLAIASRLEALEKGLNTSVRNANDALSLAQVAQGGLHSVGDNLQRIRELTVQAANGSLSDTDRGAIREEVDALKEEIGRVIDTTSFADVDVLKQSSSLDFQVGAQSGQTISINAQDLGATLSSIGFDGIDTSSAAGANSALNTLDAAISSVVDTATNFGAIQNRFDSAISALSGSAINAAEARSRIQDTDVAAATARVARDSVLNQAGTALLTQANQSSAVVAKLLG